MAEQLGDSFQVFSYGCGGYGSLQEYMILDKYFDIIDPDIIIIQTSSNDISDNYFSETSLNTTITLKISGEDISFNITDLTNQDYLDFHFFYYLFLLRINLILNLY